MAASAFRVGFSLMPHEPTLELLAGLIEDEVELYEVTPETLWFQGEDRGVRPNGFHRRFEELRQRTGRPFVAHGVGWSAGSYETPEQLERDDVWLRAMAETHAALDFAWYTDHLGATVLDGEEISLPVGLPMTGAMADHVHARLARLQSIVPKVGLENTCAYYLHGSPATETQFLKQILRGSGQHLLLDLHNLHTMANNLGFEALALLRQLPLERVIEIHLSGGSTSEAAWLPSGRALRLDSHDSAVPEVVWELAERVVPLCQGLKAVVLERMEGTVSADDVPLLREELRRIRGLRGDS